MHATFCNTFNEFPVWRSFFKINPKKKEKKTCLLLFFLHQVKCQSSRSDLTTTFKQVLGNLQFNLGDLDTFKQLTQCQKEKKSNITFHSLLIDYLSPRTFEMCTLKVNHSQVITVHKICIPYLQVPHVILKGFTKRKKIRKKHNN